MVILSGCHANKQARSHSRSRYFEDVTMSRHSKITDNPNGIDRNGTYPTRRRADGTIITEPYVAPSKTDLRDKYADKLSVGIKQVRNTTLYYFIDEWYGTPYHMGGTTKNGIDCSGFVQKLYQEVYNYNIPRSSREQYTNCKISKNTNKAEEGDLIFFKTFGKNISHVGVYLWNDFFVHASTSQGIVISSLNEEYWKKHFAGVGRIGK